MFGNFKSEIEANYCFCCRRKLTSGPKTSKREIQKKIELQRDCEAAVSQQQNEAEELDRLTHENQRLDSKNKRLQREVEAALNEIQLAQKQFPEDREACGRHEEAVEKEKARCLTEYKKLEMHKKEPSEKRLTAKKDEVFLQK